MDIGVCLPYCCCGKTVAMCCVSGGAVDGQRTGRGRYGKSECLTLEGMNRHSKCGWERKGGGEGGRSAGVLAYGCK